MIKKNNNSLETIKEKDEFDFTNIFDQLGYMMKKINDTESNEEEDEESFNKMMKTMQGISQGLQDKIKKSMDVIKNDKNIPEETKKMFTEFNENISKIGSEDMDTKELQNTTQNFMKSFQDLMSKTMPEALPSNDKNNSDLENIIRRVMKEELESVNKKISNIENRCDIHEKVMKHLSDKKN